MSERMWIRWSWLGLLCAASCAAQQTPPPGAAAQRGFRDPTASRVPRMAAELHGLWVEYWAPSGAADTQRFVFSDGGRFTWSAPHRDGTKCDATRKAGLFSLERKGSDQEITLYITTEEYPNCDGQTPAGSLVREHDPALVERYELGECPDNHEASALDAEYACVAIAGHAFWRRPLPAAEVSARLWHQP